MKKNYFNTSTRSLKYLWLAAAYQDTDQAIPSEPTRGKFQGLSKLSEYSLTRAMHPTNMCSHIQFAFTALIFH